MAQFILYSIAVFLVTIIAIVIILLVAKKYLSPSGNVNITVNGDKVLNVPQGNNLMATLNENGIFLPSACGGKASCGQCKVQVLEGGGEILDSEKPHFTRKQIKDHWRLGCQCKVKSDMNIHVDESILGVKEYECTVISNKNVATFIKEFKVQLPAGEHMDFLPGSYAQIKIPAFDWTSIRASLATSICLRGRSSASSHSSVRTPSPPSVPTLWPTILPREMSSCSPCVSPHLRSRPTRAASWRSTRVSPRRISSR